MGAGACDSGSGTNMDAPLVLMAVSDTVVVAPGGVASVAFSLTTTGGLPAVGLRVDFAAVEDPASPGGLAGATLSASSAVTDQSGIAAVTVTGSKPTSFNVAGRNPRASVAQVNVVVAASAERTINVLPEPAMGAQAAATAASVALTMYDGLSCADLLVMAPGPAAPGMPAAGQLGQPATFTVDSTLDHAVAGAGRDATGALVATGCANIPRTALPAGTVVDVYLPLTDLALLPGGAYTLTTQLSLARGPLALSVAAPWQDLVACPLDPSQLWLDCTIDALGSPPGDSLDCVPAASEGALGDAIMARRGAVPAGSLCRSPTLAAGGPSLDAELASLFPTPAPSPISDLPMLAAELSAILDQVSLQSTLALQPTAVRGTFLATHLLRAATFTVGTTVTSIDVVAQGLPTSFVRFVPVTATGTSVTIGTHVIGLGLGSLAHTAFAKAALAARGLPSDTRALLDAMFGLAAAPATADATRATGCDALDAVVCSDVGRNTGCLRAACLAGLTALATKLDAAFLSADSDGAGLQLSGSAPMLDDDGDGIADRLGASNPAPGVWSVELRAHAGTEVLSAPWTGVTVRP